MDGTSHIFLEHRLLKLSLFPRMLRWAPRPLVAGIVWVGISQDWGLGGLPVFAYVGFNYPQYQDVLINISFLS